ncbi:anti-anti-sigma factor [Vibrio xiamenensis]|uniref:Anti-anti-sigma factor n=1 Tax=Vibrio xiamenensis TaxID=861298 RepID=A0A1G7XEE5_9VIBR|nr:STAS domain-containing protein [Vibrio xiamenensis]SDG82618.1 anti-anti-sigma factor [Vibrio xiamenensis]
MDCVLNESLDISTVLESVEVYKSWLEKSESSVVLDASKVQRVDAAGIQALASLMVTAQHNKLSIHLTNPPKVLSEGITILGLQKIFDVID